MLLLTPNGGKLYVVRDFNGHAAGEIVRCEGVYGGKECGVLKMKKAAGC